ncbi:hypothetical protein [Microbulbifer sp. THAF38]|uniref:hypothetical protein n=1 Tax=Microbulbifer sp. THAF38 TaxID=2587856 RepID=UPI001268FAC3|nr:hypothetical protein [Microbulbifer sp. THAF38]QFT55668.1 hypothetical protein FIU95_14055 [Microbulbifer sp. THAF38]
MNDFTPKLTLPAALFILALGSSTSALSQVSDSAQSMITLTVNEFITIENVGNINLAPMQGQAAQQTDFFCVAGSGFTQFSITFAGVGTGTGNPFTLQGTGTSTLNYQVSFLNATSGPAPTLVQPNVPVMNNTLQAVNCADDNALFNIFIPASAWEPVADMAPFMGTLMLTVESQ